MMQGNAGSAIVLILWCKDDVNLKRKLKSKTQRPSAGGADRTTGSLTGRAFDMLYEADDNSYKQIAC